MKSSKYKKDKEKRQESFSFLAVELNSFEKENDLLNLPEVTKAIQKHDSAVKIELTAILYFVGIYFA